MKELSRKKSSVKVILEKLLRCEDNYLFTNDPEFLKSKIPKNEDKNKFKSEEEKTPT